jgi:lysozyme
MNISKEGICELASYECMCLKPYLDSVGVKTVGVGSTASDIPDLASWSWDKELTVEEVVSLYKKGLSKYVDGVNKALNKDVGVSQQLFDALVSITYNIGVGGMTKSTFMKRINARDTIEHIVQSMSSWNKAGGKLSKGLVNRRAKEAKLILTGVYSSGGYTDLVPVINKHPIYKSGKKLYLMPYL